MLILYNISWCIHTYNQSLTICIVFYLYIFNSVEKQFNIDVKGFVKVDCFPLRFFKFLILQFVQYARLIR